VNVSRTLLKSASEATRLACKLDRPADAVLSEFFRQNRQLGSHDRPFVADTVFSVLRNKRLLEHVVPEPDSRRLVLTSLLKLQGISLRALESLTGPLDREWLLAAKQAPTDSLPIAVRLSLPDWLWERLDGRYGEDEAARLGRSLLKPAPLDLRVNPLLANREEVLKALEAQGLEAVPTPYSPLGIRLHSNPALNRDELFLSGKIEVQDEGSQLVGMLVAPARRQMVVDFCAGAGGKTLLMGAIMHNQGRLYAFDVSTKRLESLKRRLKRSQLSNVHPQMIGSERDPRIKRLAGKIDRVLVDAPCSGLGTLRRNPDMKWRQSPTSVNELAEKQRRILAASSQLLKPGGRLVYATCSLLRAENEDIVEQFLTAQDGRFRSLDSDSILAPQGVDLKSGQYLQVSPDKHQCDAFFGAVLERVSAT
jgi:16S rRNA (cytosine967-C5)-methyltransferase